MDSIYLNGSDDVRRGGAMAESGGADMLRAAHIMSEAAGTIRNALQEHTDTMRQLLEEHREAMKPEETVGPIAITMPCMHEWVLQVDTMITKCGKCGMVR